jgi:uncharacterized protein DUF11
MFRMFRSGMVLNAVTSMLLIAPITIQANAQVTQPSGGSSTLAQGLTAISIAQNVVGQGGEFEYLAAGFAQQNFVLTPQSNQSDTISFDNLAPGVFTIFAIANPSYKLENIVCVGDSDGGNYIDVSQGVIEFDLDAGENQSCVFSSIEVVANAEPQSVDLKLEKSVSDTEFWPDTGVWEYQYIIQVSNEGSAFSHTAGIEISDPPQIGVEFISASGSGWQCNENQMPLKFPFTLNCKFEIGGGQLVAGEILPPLQIQARVSESGTYRNCAAVWANSDLNIIESELANNQNCVDVDAVASLEKSDLEISVSGPPRCQVGGKCKIDVSILNAGYLPFTGPLLILDAADPHELSGKLATNENGWKCFRPKNSSAICGIAPLSIAAGDKVELTIPLRVPNSYRAGDLIQNCVGFARLKDIQFPSEIHELQLLLNMLNFDVGAVDGKRGSRTREGEAAFRRMSGLPSSASILGDLRRVFSNLPGIGSLANGQSCVEIEVVKAAVRSTPRKPAKKSCVLPEVLSPITGQCVNVISTCPFGSVLNVFTNQCVQISP